MPESFIRLPQDGTGKMARAFERLVGVNTVYENVVQTAQEMTFVVTTGINAFAASRFHLIIHNTSGTHMVALKRLVWQPVATAATGALSGPWELRRREGPTTVPAGGAITPSSMDSIDTLPSGISVHSIPTTTPVAGTLRSFGFVHPQPDELKLSTLDAPTFQALFEGGGLTVFDSRFGGEEAKGVRARQNQSIEFQQDATAGTGNARIYAVFTVLPL